MKKQNKLAIVVLFWNDSEKTLKCLNSLFQQKKQKFKIVLVDNNSDQKYTQLHENARKSRKKRRYRPRYTPPFPDLWKQRSFQKSDQNKR